MWYGMVWFGMVWFGLVWYGLETKPSLLSGGWLARLHMRGKPGLYQEDYKPRAGEGAFRTPAGNFYGNCIIHVWFLPPPASSSSTQADGSPFQAVVGSARESQAPPPPHGQQE